MSTAAILSKYGQGLIASPGTPADSMALHGRHIGP